MNRYITLSSDEMLRRWKLAGLYEPLLADGTVECIDGIDSDRLLRMHIDRWYFRQLMQLSPERLPLTDIASRLTLSSLPDGAARVSLPEAVLRVVSVMMDGWMQPAIIVTDPESPLAKAQSNRFSRGAPLRPVVTVNTDHSMTLYTPTADVPPRLISVKAVCCPPDGTYVLTPEMLPDNL